MSKLIAIVPARGGSKGIQQKNIVPLCGFPLIHYTLSAALESALFDRIYVSSDDTQILSVAEQEGALSIRRSAELSADTSPTDPVIMDIIQRESLSSADIIVLLQPTSPLRTAQHIRDAVSLYQHHAECQLVLSVIAIDNKVLKAYIAGNEFLQPILSDQTAYQRRQDLPPVYLPNGALYIFSAQDFLREEKIPRRQIIPFLMSDQDSIDIDTLDDLARVAAVLATRKQLPLDEEKITP